jgi:hypothetical protein
MFLQILYDFLVLITNMATVQNFYVMFGKFNVVRICNRGNLCTEVDR